MGYVIPSASHLDLPQGLLPIGLTLTIQVTTWTCSSLCEKATAQTTGCLISLPFSQGKSRNPVKLINFSCIYNVILLVASQRAWSICNSGLGEKNTLVFLFAFFKHITNVFGSANPTMQLQCPCNGEELASYLLVRRRTLALISAHQHNPSFI